MLFFISYHLKIVFIKKIIIIIFLIIHFFLMEFIMNSYKESARMDEERRSKSFSTYTPAYTPPHIHHLTLPIIVELFERLFFT